jgi:alpha-L-rhamnosidase
MNHCMLGHIQQWFLGSLAGIRPEPVSPGFARFIIAPEPVGKVNWARGEYQSIRGRIASSWRIQDGRFRLGVTIPPNTTAMVFVPALNAENVQESGRTAADSVGVRFLRHERGKAVFEVGSGEYEFVVAER